MGAGVDRARELREARELFVFAIREGLPMAEAKKRLAAERWKAADARLANRKCGTAAAPSAGDAVEQAPLPYYLREPYV